MEEIKTFTCEVEGCGKEFDKQSKLYGHNRMVHKGNGDITETTLSMSPQPKDINMNLTPEEQAIAQRVSAQDSLWESINEADLMDFSLAELPYQLPPECKKRQDEKVYAFRYCERTAERIDFLTSSVQPPKSWLIVNKQQCPWIPDKYIDPILGCVPHLEQMLLFKPWAWHMIVQNAKHALSEGQDRGGSIENRDGSEAMGGGVKMRAAGGRPSSVSEDIKIGGSDVVIADEAVIDHAAGIVGDTSDLGDTFEE